jgi:hypothetical protein
MLLFERKQQQAAESFCTIGPQCGWFYRHSAKTSQLPLRIMSIIGITTTVAPEGAFDRFP